MSRSSRILFLHVQTRFYRNSRGVLLTNASWARYEAWTQYLSEVDEIRLIARVTDETNEVGYPVEGSGVTVLPMPFYSGVSGYMLALPKLVGLVKSLPSSPAHIYGGRAADPMTDIIQQKARRSGSHFLLQIVGDPAESLSAGTFGTVGKLLSAPVAAWVRWQVRKSSAALFVTRETLQRRYPPRQGTITAARSNIEFTDSSFASASRDYNTKPTSTPLKLVTVGGQSQTFKGHDHLISAIASLNGSGLDVQATIIGGGRHHQYYREYARSQHVADYVSFTGHISSQDAIRGLLSECDIFVLPSLTEGLPRALIEAMAQGIACIGSDVGGISELLPAEALFAPGSADAIASKVREVHNDPQLLTEWARKGFSRAHEIRATQAGPEVLSEFFREIVAAPPASRRRSKVGPK